MLAVARAVLAVDVPGSRRRVAGISGFGGAGKSTLADTLSQMLPGSVVVPGDEFLLTHPPTERSDHWGEVDGHRLVEQVLQPARRGHTARCSSPWP